MNRSVAVGIVLLLVGIFVFLFISIIIGIVAVVVGLIVFYYGRRAAARLARESTGAGPFAPSTGVPPAASPTVSSREAGKIRCKYCGALNEAGKTTFCTSCGASLN